jgi:hypothetical protein
MMCLARRASLIVVLLLTSVGTASAECAWVLWVHFKPVDTDVSRWEVGSGSTTVAECAAARTQKQEHWKRSASRMPKAYLLGDTMFVPSDGRLAAWEAVCLPDTIDPRGPKGK